MFLANWHDCFRLIMDNFDLLFNDTVINDPTSLNYSENPRFLKNFSILSINVNSFNMSTMNANHKNTNWFIPKLNHVLSNKCSVYLLQDIRLSSNTNSVEKFTNELKCTMHGNFDVFLNSSKGSGGTAILLAIIKLSKNLDLIVKTLLDLTLFLTMLECQFFLSMVLEDKLIALIFSKNLNKKLNLLVIICSFLGETSIVSPILIDTTEFHPFFQILIYNQLLVYQMLITASF